MTSERENLKRALKQYVSDTYDDISTIQVFSNRCDQRIQDRKAEVRALTELTETEESEKELGAVLGKTLSGLKDLQRPLEALERLTVTSVCVFQKNLNPEMDLENQTVRLLILTAHIPALLLLLLKQDNQKFFHPNALNKDVFKNLLQCYILTIRIFFYGWKSNALNNFNQVQPKIDLRDVSEQDIKKMPSQIHTLSALRADQAFIMVLLFQGRSQDFREKFCELKPQMEMKLSELEACALKLDSMHKRARISGVVSSATGAVTGILIMIGLASIPFPPLAFGCEVAVMVVGLVSGVQGIVTTSVEHGVNNTQSDRAKKAFKRCVTIMNELQGFLNDVIQQHFEGLKEDVLNEVILATFAGAVFGADLADPVSVTCEKVIRKRLSAEALRHVTEGERAISPVKIRGLRVAKVVKNGAFVLNSVFVGADGYFLYKDAQALAQGTETEHSRWIRARTALWRVEIETWQKVHNFLREGEKEFEKNKEMLEKSFYPQM